MKHLFLATLAVLPLFTAEPVVAQVVSPLHCRMDYCSDSILVSKTPIRQSTYGTLYEFVQRSRDWYSPGVFNKRASTSQVPYGKPRTIFVLCSTTRPAVIFRGGEYGTQYYAHLLNPDGQTSYGYNTASYETYWLVCHNLVGLDSFTPEMASRAIKLGYPGVLPQHQIMIDHPLDILKPILPSPV